MASRATDIILSDIINPGIISHLSYTIRLHIPNPYYYGCVTQNPWRQNAPCNSLHTSAQYRQVSASSLVLAKTFKSSGGNIKIKILWQILWRKYLE